jgi:hypothetical protein
MDHHPAADAFPMMDAKRFDELKADIEKHGQREPVTLCEGKILDGRNRWKACKLLKIETQTRQYDGDPWAYVWSLNGERRDLVNEQRYLIWKECHEQSEAWQAQLQEIAAAANEKRSQAAKEQPRTPDGKRLAGKQVREQSVPAPEPTRPGKAAKAAASKTNPGAVARGDRLAKQRPDLAEKVRLGEMKPAEAHRQMKHDEVSQKVVTLPDGKFTVIYADPPWTYSDKQAVKGDFGTGTGAADCHYPSMSLAELKALGVPGIAAENSAGRELHAALLRNPEQLLLFEGM